MLTDDAKVSRADKNKFVEAHLSDADKRMFLEIEGLVATPGDRLLLAERLTKGRIAMLEMNMRAFFVTLPQEKGVQAQFQYVVTNIFNLEKFFLQLHADHELAISKAQAAAVLEKEGQKIELNHAEEEILQTRWLTLTDAEIQEQQKNFAKLSALLQGPRGVRSRHHDNLSRLSIIFEAVNKHKNITLEKLIKIKNNAIQYDPNGNASTNDAINPGDIATLITSLQGFITSNVATSVKIQTNNLTFDVLTILVALCKFLMQVKSSFNHSTILAERLLKVKLQEKPRLKESSSEEPLTARSESPTSPSQMDESSSSAPMEAIKPEKKDADKKTKYKKKYREANARLLELDASYQALQATLTEQQAQLLKLQQANQQERLETMRALQEERDAIQRERISEQAQIQAQISALQTQSAAMEQQVRADLAASQTTSAQKDQRITALEGDLAQLQQQRVSEQAQAQAEKNALQQQSVASEQQVRAELAAHIAQKDQRITALESGLAEQQQQVGTLQAELQAARLAPLAQPQPASGIEAVNSNANDELRAQLASQQQTIARMTNQMQRLRALAKPKKMPWWFYGLAAVRVVASLALIATGVGAVIGVPLLAGVSIGVAAAIVAGGGLLAVTSGAGIASAAIHDHRATKRYKAALDDRDPPLSGPSSSPQRLVEAPRRTTASELEMPRNAGPARDSSSSRFFSPADGQNHTGAPAPAKKPASGFSPQ